MHRYKIYAYQHRNEEKNKRKGGENMFQVDKDANNASKRYLSTQNKHQKQTGFTPIYKHHALPLFPIVVAVLILLRLLRTASSLAGETRSTADYVVARFAVGLRLFVVGLARLDGFQQAILSGVNCGGRLDRGGLLGGGAFVVGSIIIPANNVLGRGSYIRTSTYESTRHISDCRGLLHL